MEQKELQSALLKGGSFAFELEAKSLTLRTLPDVREMLGHKRAGRPYKISPMLHKEDAALLASRLKECAVGAGKPFRLECRLKDVKGALRDTLLQGKARKAGGKWIVEGSGTLQRYDGRLPKQERAAYNTIPLGMLCVDTKGNMIFANQTFFDWLSTGSKGSTLRQLLPEHHKLLSPHLSQAFRGKDSVCSKLIIKTGRKPARHLQAHFTPYRLGSEKSVRILLQDITELKETEEKLIQSTDWLKALMDNTPSIIFMKDRKGKFFMVNDQLARMLGTTAEDMIGKTDHDYFSKAAADHYRQYDLKVLATKQPLVLEETVPNEGVPQHFVTSKFPVFDTVRNDYVLYGIGTNITELKQAQNTIQKTEEQLRMVNNNLPVLIAHLDVDERYLFVNESYEEWFNLKASSIVGKTVREVVGPNIYKHAKPHYVNVRKGRESSYEAWIRDGMGKNRYVRCNYRPQFDGKGKVIGIYLLVQDLTDFKLLADELEAHKYDLESIVSLRTAELSESRRTLLTLIGNLPGMVYRCKNDKNWSMEFISDGCLDLTGYKPELFINNQEKRFSDLIHPDDRTRVWNEVQQAIARKCVFKLSYRIITAKKKHKWVLEHGSGVFDEKGKLQALEGFITDVTDSKEAEQAMRYSEEKFRVMFENAPAGISLCTLNGIMVEANKAYLDIIGCTREMLGKRTFMEITPPEYAEIDAANLKEVNETGRFGPFEKEYINQKTGRRVPVMLHGMKMKDPHGHELVWAIVLDITAQKQEEERQERIMRELARSNTELERFAYVASHDLQEPIRMISSYTQMLRQNFGDKMDDESRQYLQFLNEGAANMRTLVSNLLAYSRLDAKAGRFERTDLNRVMDYVLTNLNDVVRESGVDIKIAKLPTVNADATQMAQLFQNIIANALKYRAETPLKVKIGAEKRNNDWLFFIKDNGIGIEPEYHKEVFGLFKRLHDRSTYPGTGLGLAICRRVVENHNGEIWVESTPGNGATFFFTLPVS